MGFLVWIRATAGLHRPLAGSRLHHGMERRGPRDQALTAARLHRCAQRGCARTWRGKAVMSGLVLEQMAMRTRGRDGGIAMGLTTSVMLASVRACTLGRAWGTVQTPQAAK
jgi:hypothetical protein